MGTVGRPRLNAPGRLALGLAACVPLLVDPWGGDTQLAKTLLLTAAGALCLAGAARARPGEGARLAGSPAIGLLALLCGWSAFLLHHPGNVEIAFTRVLFLLGLVGLACGWRRLAEAEAAERWASGVLVVGLLAMALDGAAVLLAAEQVSPSAVKHASWLFVHNNMAASFAVVLVPLIAARALAAPHAGRRRAWGAGLVLTVLYLLLLRSRAGLLGAALGLGLVGLLALRPARAPAARGRPRLRLALAGLLVLGVALAPLSAGVRGLAKDVFYRGVSVLGLDFADTSFRPLIWRKTIEMAVAHPLEGVGPGNFPVEFPRHERQLLAKPHAHNDLLQVLGELGVPGAALFVATLIAAAAGLARRRAAAADRAARCHAAGWLAALVVFVVAGLFEVPFMLASTGMLFAMLVGVSGAGVAAAAPARVPARVPARARAALALIVALPLAGLSLARLSSGLYAAQAEAALRAGDLPALEQACGRLVALRLGVAHPHALLGRGLLAAGRAEEALAAFGRARRLWPWNAELAAEESEALLALGRADEAVATLRFAVELSPTRRESVYKLVRALDDAGRLDEALDRLEYLVRSNFDVGLDAVQRLGDMWRRAALARSGEARRDALIAARHFYAIVLDDGPAAVVPIANPVFRNLTHELQILPCGLDGWWGHYQRFLDQGGWNLPASALYTSVEGDAIRLYPGWRLPLGPPLPGAWRRL